MLERDHVLQYKGRRAREGLCTVSSLRDARRLCIVRKMNGPHVVGALSLRQRRHPVRAGVFFSSRASADPPPGTSRKRPALPLAGSFRRIVWPVGLGPSKPRRRPFPRAVTSSSCYRDSASRCQYLPAQATARRDTPPQWTARARTTRKRPLAASGPRPQQPHRARSRTCADFEGAAAARPPKKPRVRGSASRLGRVGGALANTPDDESGDAPVAPPVPPNPSVALPESECAFGAELNERPMDDGSIRSMVEARATARPSGADAPATLPAAADEGNDEEEETAPQTEDSVEVVPPTAANLARDKKTRGRPKLPTSRQLRI